jgi:hypothetical protein
MEKIIFKLEMLEDLQADNIGIDLKGHPQKVIRMLCLAMEQWDAVKIAILSAAKNYVTEHNVSL